MKTDTELLELAQSLGWKQITGGADDPFGEGHKYDFWINRANDRVVGDKTMNTMWSTKKLLEEMANEVVE